MWFDYLAILLDSRKAEGMSFTIDLVTPDTGETYVIERSNATLTSIPGFQAPDPELAVTINRSDLEAVMMRKETLASQAAAGRAKLDGDAKVLDQLMSCLVHFDPAFEIIPGALAAAPAVEP